MIRIDVSVKIKGHRILQVIGKEKIVQYFG